MAVYSLSGRQQVLFFILLDAWASRLHLQGGGGGLLCGWLDEMSKQFCLLQQVLKSVGPVCLLHRQEDSVIIQEQSSESCNVKLQEVYLPLSPRTPAQSL